MTPRELVKPSFVIKYLKTAKVSNSGKTLPCDINQPISLFTSILSLTLQQLHPRPSMYLSWSSHRCIMLLPPLLRKLKVSLMIILISIFTLFSPQFSQISEITTFRIVLLYHIISSKAFSTLSVRRTSTNPVENYIRFLITYLMSKELFFFLTFHLNILLCILCFSHLCSVIYAFLNVVSTFTFLFCNLIYANNLPLLSLLRLLSISTNTAH